MATIEEVRSKLKDRLGKFKIQTPTRVAYLGDGRGNATSNMVPVGEPNKFWARESLDGDKPFKITNKNPNLTPAFNLPVLLGYPEHDPETEQVLGLHSALIKLDAGGNISGSSIGGTSPHHQKHEWGGGDTVYVDPRMFKPGLIAPTTPVSMRVKVLAFQHYYNFWRRYDGGVSPDLSQYIPDSDYRYVMLCLDPDTNQLVVHPGSVFTPDLSIDSIISNQATNTFRHIPVPPGNEIPLGVVLLEPDTTKVDWNPEGVNNLMPMRILLSSPMKEVNERLSLIESTTGISSLPQTGAANSVENDLLPGRIDGNRTRLVLNRSNAIENLPDLFVGEIGYVNSTPSGIVMGTASGNKLIPLGGGGGGASVLGDLGDVTLTDLTGQRVLQYDEIAGIWQASRTLSAIQLSAGDDAGVFVYEEEGVAIRSSDSSPITIYTYNNPGLRFAGETGMTDDVEFNTDNDPNLRFLFWNSNRKTLAVSESEIRFSVSNSPSAISVLGDDNKVAFNNDNSLSPLIHFDYTTNHVTIGSGLSQLNEGNFEIHSPSNIRLNSIGHFNHYSPTLNRATTYSYHFKNESGSMVEVFNQAFATVTASYGTYGFTGLSAGILRSGLFTIDTFAGEIVANNLGSTLDFRAESSANAQQFKVDAKLNAVQIGTSVAGQIADFRDHLIEFNKNNNDTDFLVKGTGACNTLFVDAGLNRVGIGTQTPQRILDVIDETNGNVAIQLTNRSLGTNAQIQYRLDVAGDGAYVIGCAASTHSGVFPQYAGRGYFETNTLLNGLTMTAAAAAGTIDFKTGGRSDSNRRMLINSDGVGVNTSSPNAPLHVYLAEDSIASGLHIGNGSNGFWFANSTGTGFAPYMYGRTVEADDLLVFGAVIAPSADAGTRACFWLDARRDNNTDVATRPLVSITNRGSEKLIVHANGGVVIGSPTGGNKGAGTLNAQAVYDDNVLLTCYPIEYARTGSINLVEMDSKYGRGGKHTRAHDFSKKARGLIDVREYSKKWKKDGHLPLLPSRQEWESRQQIPVGEMTQSLAETVELQAIHIDNLQQQIDELKSMIKGLNNE